MPNFKEDLLDKSDVKAGCRKEISKVYLLGGISARIPAQLRDNFFNLFSRQFSIDLDFGLKYLPVKNHFPQGINLDKESIFVKKEELFQVGKRF